MNFFNPYSPLIVCWLKEFLLYCDASYTVYKIIKDDDPMNQIFVKICILYNKKLRVLFL